jgi:hypothetical protein
MLAVPDNENCCTRSITLDTGSAAHPLVDALLEHVERRSRSWVAGVHCQFKKRRQVIHSVFNLRIAFRIK